MRAAARRITNTPESNPRRTPPGSQAPASQDPYDEYPQDAPGGNPGGDGDPPGDDEPSEPRDSDDDENPPNLAAAIALLAKSVRRPSEEKTKVREPDTFDGSDPKKLEDFRVQCEVNFRSRERSFRTDKSKVTFALSYLRGTALKHFEPSILRRLNDDWENDYDLFLEELETNFGPFDPIDDAEVGLDVLEMKENHRYIKFSIAFNHFAASVDWNESALRHSFYRALPDRIKHEMSLVDRPNTLKGLKALTRQIDARYWRRQEEIKRDNRQKSGPSGSSNDKSGNKPTSSKNTNTSTSTPSSSSTQKPSSGKPPPSSSGSNNNANQPKKTTEDLTGKLGKDGKLTTEERNRRITNNLCLFCGGTGHHASECKKAKARAARVAKNSETSSDSKK
jgi:hypothetical protein